MGTIGHEECVLPRYSHVALRDGAWGWGIPVHGEQAQKGTTGCDKGL